MTHDYLSMFIDETREHLQAWSDGLMAMERSGDAGTISVLFRAAHTIKGMAMTMGFMRMGAITHEAEGLLDDLRTGRLVVSREVTDVLLRTLDTLQALLDGIEHEGQEADLDIDEVHAQLRAVSGGHPATIEDTKRRPEVTRSTIIVQVANEARRSGYHVFEIQIGFSEGCLMPLARFAQWLTRIDQNLLLHTDPDMAILDQGDYVGDITVLLASEEDMEQVKASLLDVSDLEIRALTPWSHEPGSPVAEAQSTTARSPVVSSIPSVRKHNRTIRVETDKLDELMNLVSELAIDKTRLERVAQEMTSPILTETVDHVSRLSGQLQALIMSIRMIPVDTVFHRFPRMVRDTALQLGKEVDFSIIGAETQLDRTVVEEIGDPIMHMLRNSLDHGLETAEERTRHGKSAMGHIELRAYASGNHVFIEVADDGRGIDRDKVLQKAVLQDLIPSGSELDDQEIYQLLFASGFSTSDQVSELSGRGVGLDVVRTKIEALGGKIQVHSEQGAGSRFVIRLPITLAIMDGLLVSVGDNPYVLPISSVAETSTLQSVQTVHGQEMTLWREQLVPVVRMQTALCEAGDGHAGYLVLVRRADKIVGLAVDQLIGQQEVVVKPLDSHFKQLPHFTGATILGDGEVALILDANAFIK